ncbi:MAG: WecB/TagA/CpsF family glycosyltransferase [Planctomycetota bacterium]
MNDARDNQLDCGVAWPQKVTLFGAKYTPTTYAQATRVIIAAAGQSVSGAISCHAVHALVTFTSNSQMRDIINCFDMVLPDGQPVRWAMNVLYGTRLRERIYGPELMTRVCRQAAENGLPVYLYGGSPSVSEQLPRQLQRMYPRLTIAGSESPPYRELSNAEMDRVVDRINGSGARIVFVGLGCPKQDLFVHRTRHRIKAVQICVGAAFDLHGAENRMAPTWMQRYGLEWSYRLYKEPRRLWKRYLVTNTVYAAKLAIALLRVPTVTRQRELWDGVMRDRDTEAVRDCVEE